MTFASTETSVELGRPVELYVFSYQGGTLRYTSAADDIVYSGQTYSAVAGLTRSKIEDTGDISKNDLMITAPDDFPPAALFEVYPPSDVLELTLWRAHASDLSEAVVFWGGRVLSTSWSANVATLTCESLFTRLRQPGLRRIYSRNCPHVLYGPECRASQLANVHAVTLNGIIGDGYQIQSPAFDLMGSGFLAGGKLAWVRGGGVTERRGIRDHVGQLVTLTHPITDMPATADVSVWPGCDRTKDTCLSKFNNLNNYGGFPYMAERNPFGSSVF